LRGTGAEIMIFEAGKTYWIECPQGGLSPIVVKELPVRAPFLVLEIIETTRPPYNVIAKVAVENQINYTEFNFEFAKFGFMLGYKLKEIL
jgi:hypothetical protein